VVTSAFGTDFYLSKVSPYTFYLFSADYIKSNALPINQCWPLTLFWAARVPMAHAYDPFQQEINYWDLDSAALIFNFTTTGQLSSSRHPVLSKRFHKVTYWWYH
jgi:hypothetical protein